MLRTLRRLYRWVIPEPFRRVFRNLIIGKPPLYTKGYYQQLDEWQRAAYPILARSIMSEFRPAGVLDVGCGTGGLLVALRDQGLTRSCGFDFHAAALELCRQRGLDVTPVDLLKSRTLDPTFDLVICLEVAEHLPASAADGLVGTLTSGPGRLLFSAAQPGQGGEDHVNEQPPAYWVEKFQNAGWHLDSARTDRLKRQWAAGNVIKWYVNNVMVFERADSTARS